MLAELLGSGAQSGKIFFNVLIARTQNFRTFTIAHTDKKQYLNPNTRDHTGVMSGQGRSFATSHRCDVGSERVNYQSDEYNYCREQLMLFYPWRNESEELINVNVVELCEKYEKKIAENKAKYVYGYNSNKQSELDDAIEELICNEKKGIPSVDDAPILDETYDRVAPHYEILNNRTDEGDFAVDIGNRTSIALSTTMSKFTVPGKITDEAYFSMMKSLNEKQRKIVLQILHSAKTTQSLPIYHIILGSAGVGKSVAIEAIYQSLLRHYFQEKDYDPASTYVMKACFTGKAALNIRGLTIHTAFSIAPSQLGRLNPLNASQQNTLYSQLHNLKFILLDEVSMIGSRLMSFIHERLTMLFKNDEIFSGVSIICLGDYNQLEAVMDVSAYRNFNDKGNPLRQLLLVNPLWEVFSSYRLTDIMRQKDDKMFAELLTHLGNGMINDEEIAILESRFQVPLPNNPHPVHVCSTNKEVDAHNDEVLSNFNTNEIMTVNAVDRILDTSLSIQNQKNLLIKAKEADLKSTQLLYSIKLCLGIRYMITYNLNLPDGLVNGVIGILKRIDYDHTKTAVLGVRLEFEDNFIGREAREKCTYVIETNNIPQTWVPINYLQLQLKVGKTAGHVVLQKMLPLKMAEAITIHKSQGSMYQQIVVHRPEILNTRMLYVACSQVTSLSGLYFVDYKNGLDKKKLCQSNDRTRKEIENLELNRPLAFDLHFLQDYPEDDTFIFSNIKSLHKYYEFVKVDKSFISAKFIFLVETWTLNRDNYDIEHYRCVYRCDCPSAVRRPYGIIIFARENCNNSTNVIFESNIHNPKKEKYTSHNIVVFTVSNYCFCIVYRSPSESREIFDEIFRKMIYELKNKLPKTMKIVIVGDFNIDISDEQGKTFLNMLEREGFRQQTPANSSSTNYNTQIDLCFANCEDFDCRYYENYFGYHKPITGILNKPKKEKPNLNLSNTQSQHLVTNNAGVPLIKPIVPASTVTNNNNRISQSSTPKKEKNIPHVNSFVNDDQVSCYANSVVQSLINCKTLQITLQNLHTTSINNSDDFLKIMHTFLQVASHPLSSKPLRQYAGSPFTLNEQQDAHEFINKIAERSAIFQNLINNTLRIVKICKKCNNNSFSIDQVNFLTINSHLCAKKRDLHINDLIKLEYDTETIIEGYNCPQCNEKDCVTTKYKIINSSNVLLLYCNAFTYNKITNSYNKITNIKLKNLPNTQIVVDTIHYKLRSAIFHCGESIQHGHYISILQTQNSFIECNDEHISSCRWPRNSIYIPKSKAPTTLYLLVYEKV